MKKTFLLAIAALGTIMVTSCQKEEVGRILTATIEQYEHNAKAYINSDNYACWEDGDFVKINNTQCTIRFENGTQGAANTAIIDGSDRLTGQDLLAFYPANIVHGMSSTGGTVKLPHIQTYHENANGYQVIDNPMAACCPAEDNELKFRNLCALLKVTLQGNTSVKAIQVKGIDDQMLWGEAQLRLNSQGLPMLEEFTGGSNSVVLNFGDAVAIDGSKSFYIVMPAKSDFKHLTIAVITTDGSDHYAFHCKTSLLGKSLSRNQIGAIRYTPNGNEDEDFFPDWMIRYTATERVSPNSDHTTFGNAAYVNDNSSFANGSGILLFNGPLIEIESFAFEGNSSLTGITLPEGVNEIWTNAFRDCINLSSITLPKWLAWIGGSAFYGCTSLSSIELPEGVTDISLNAFENCSSLRSINWPAGASEIADYTFRGCSNLCSIELPETLNSIGAQAFRSCSSLSNIELPEGVTTIGNRVFEQCYNLTTVYVKRWFPGTEEPITQIGIDMFFRCDALESIFVPAGAVDTYREAEVWHYYEPYIQANPAQ